MPEIVESDVPEVGLFENPIERALPQVVAVERLLIPVAKHPRSHACAALEARGLSFRAERAERVRQVPRQVPAPFLPIFRGRYSAVGRGQKELILIAQFRAVIFQLAQGLVNRSPCSHDAHLG